MNILKRFWKGPYPKLVYLLVTSLGSAVITAAGVYGVGHLSYHGQSSIPGAAHISETFFTALIVTLITGIILHRHATRRGFCATLAHHKRCPFLGLLLLGLSLGGVFTAIVWVVQGTGDVPYEAMMAAKVVEGFFLGLLLPWLFVGFGLLRHPDIRPIITTPPSFEPVTGEMGSVAAYLRNLCIGTLIANVVLFPGLCWLFYHSKPIIDGAIVGSEIFFGGLLCTLISGTTGHFETAGRHGCRSCQKRGACPFLGILFLGLGLGVLCALVGHVFLGNDPVTFRTLMWVKVVQGLFLGIAIPLALVGTKLLLHPQVAHRT